MVRVNQPTKATAWKCPDCGDEVEVEQPSESWPCVVCGADMEVLEQ